MTTTHLESTELAQRTVSTARVLAAPNDLLKSGEAEPQRLAPSEG